MMRQPLSALCVVPMCLGALGGSAAAQSASEAGIETAPPFSGRVLATGLEWPWELMWGPDERLWVSERAGKRVTRIDPETGAKQVALTIDEVLVGGQHEGLLGMALHPELLQGRGNDFVYVAYTYDADPAPGEGQVERRAKLVRFTYDRSSETLGQPSELIAGIPAGTDHNAGRIKFGPGGMLYYATGDQGGNWLGNYCNPIRAQVLPTAGEIRAKDWSSYTGKILRLAPDGGIPADNPPIDGVRSHILSYGHRNPQGLAFGPDGALYSAEHGEKTDDEINLIEAGMNYGWPHVLGFQDDQAYTFGNWSAAANCADLTFSAFSFPDGVPQQGEADWSAPNFREPLKTLYTVHDGYDFEDPSCGEARFICYPSIGPSSIDFYPEGGAIPGWGNSLLVTALKNGALYVLKLTGAGPGIRDADQVLDTVNRYRDLALSPDARTIYIATDSGGIARDASGGATDQLAHPGAILEFTYTGDPTRRAAAQ
jgi:PQQ-dependent dehydrogenase (s-GDH family)